MNTAFSNPKRVLSSLSLQPGQIVADFGAGSGHYSFAVSGFVGGGKVIAVEIQKKLVEKLTSETRQRKLNNVSVEWGNIEEIGGTGIQENSVDVVLMVNTLFQLEDKEGVFKEAARIIKPGGKLLVVDWSESHGGLGPQPDHVVDEQTARDLAKRNRFSVENSVAAGAHHYGFIARASR